MACHFYGGLVDTADDVVEIEDLPEEEPKVVGVSMPVREHPELMEPQGWRRRCKGRLQPRELSP